MKASNADIYEYQFNALFQKVKTLIGGRTIRTYKNEEEEAIDKEVDDYIGCSTLLFDVSGKDFRWFKAADSEYRYWVEVYILKIIENIMTKLGIRFEEKYHSGHKEQHSIICNLNGRQVEAYFLYDIEYEEANCTDYDKIASVLKAESPEVDAIEIFIFRDCISTLGSLNSFVTSKDAKLAITAKIRGCIHRAISLWTQYQRNGYFHKDNLYASDNKIEEVRELTIYLYFLILGGLRFSVEEKNKLGVYKHDGEDTRQEYNEEAVYQSFEEWMNNTISFDLPERIPGLWILITNDENIWTVHTHLLTYFYIDEFESSDFDFSPDKIAKSHTKDVSEFSWVSDDKEYINAQNNLIHLFDRYSNAHPVNMNRIGAIVLGIDKYTQLIHYRE